MKTEKQKAIAWLQDEIRSLRLAPTINGCGPEPWAEQLEIMETCLEAVKVHFPDTAKMVPLTLKQLREMDGQPVWIHTFSSKSKKTNIEQWALVASAGEYSVSFIRVAVAGRMEKRCKDYGQTWLAYAYPPAHIDREAWDPCGMCGGKTTLYQHTNTTKLFMNTFGKAATLVTECMACPPYADCCMKGISANSAFRINFCPECGRPLTPEAWAELEKRLRG